jgi:hypothetical protein
MTESRYLDPEDEAFNEIERRAKQRMESVKVAVHTLTEYQRGYETGFIDGMQKQAQSSVDKAVNAMSQRTEQNFCSRCGKRTKDSTHIHTCTPPVAQQESVADDFFRMIADRNPKPFSPPQRTWVGLDWLPEHKCGLHLSHNEHRDV